VCEADQSKAFISLWVEDANGTINLIFSGKSTATSNLYSLCQFNNTSHHCKQIFSWFVSQRYFFCQINFKKKTM